MYVRRGASPTNISNNNSNGSGGQADNVGRMPVMGFYHLTVIVYDFKLAAIEVIASLFFIALLFFIFLFGYKSTIPDPISNIKSTYYISQFICIAISFGLVFVIGYFIKDRERCIFYLKLLFVASLIPVIIFLGIRLHMDNTYTESKFSKIFDSEYSDQYDANGKHITANVKDAVSVSTNKEYFVEKNLEAYSWFKLRSFLQICLYLLVLVFIGYAIYNTAVKYNKLDKLSKDDEILFDEEENVKF